MNERQWLIIDSPGEKCAFLNVYAACNSFTSEDFIQWNQDLFSLITSEAILLRNMGYIVLAMGDFNSRVGQLQGLEGNTCDTNRNTPMFLNFLAEVNLLIINTFPIAKVIINHKFHLIFIHVVGIIYKVHGSRRCNSVQITLRLWPC